MDDDDKHIASIETKLAVLARDVEALTRRITELVTRVEFLPVKMVSFGMVALILASTIAAVLSMVLRK